MLLRSGVSPWPLNFLQYSEDPVPGPAPGPGTFLASGSALEGVVCWHGGGGGGGARLEAQVAGHLVGPPGTIVSAPPFLVLVPGHLCPTGSCHLKETARGQEAGHLASGCCAATKQPAGLGASVSGSGLGVFFCPARMRRPRFTRLRGVGTQTRGVAGAAPSDSQRQAAGGRTRALGEQSPGPAESAPGEGWGPGLWRWWRGEWVGGGGGDSAFISLLFGYSCLLSFGNKDFILDKTFF